MLSVVLVILKVAAVIISTTTTTTMKSDPKSTTTTPNKQYLDNVELTSFTSSIKSSIKHLDNDEITGNVRGEFPCVWQNYNGNLTAGSKAVVFTGSFFLFEKTLILQWDDIRKVVLADYSVLEASNPSAATGLEIVLNDDKVHTFTNLHAPEKVWLLLITLHSDAILGRQTHPTPTPRFKRRNSDPAAASISNIGSLLFSTPVEEDIVVTSSQNSPRPVIRTVTSMAENVSRDFIEQAEGKLKLQPIPCTHAGVAGQMYTGKTAVYFTGKRYFWNHLVVTIPWSTIRQIQLTEKTSSSRSTTPVASPVRQSSNKETGATTAVPLCVGLTIVAKEPAVRVDGGATTTGDDSFYFCEMKAPDKVWASLIAMHNEKLRAISQPPRAHTSPIVNRRKSLRRLTSDPMLCSQLNFEYDAAAVENVDDLPPPSMRYKSSVGFVSDASITAVEVQMSNDDHGATTNKSAPSSLHNDAWAAVRDQSSDKDVYTNLVMGRYALPDCSLDKFFDSFLADKAVYSLARYLEGRGDFDVRSTDWADVVIDDDDGKERNNNNNNKKRRVVQYMHPVNVPLAPPQAKARKEQTVSRYGDSGILIETQTFVDDVPMADCFYVADRIRIEPSSVQSATTTTTAVTVTMEFGITFVKSTMFKGIISRKTTSEFTDFFQSMAQYMSDALAGNIKPDIIVTTSAAVVDNETIVKSIETAEDGAIKVPVALPAAPGQNQRAFTIDRMLLLFMLLLQFWILIELRSIKSAMLLLDKNSSTNGHCEVNELSVKST